MNADDQLEQFRRDGWCRFVFDPALARWVAEILPAARDCVRAPEQARWLRCGGTWFVGVNALPNGSNGALAGGRPLAGRAVEFIREQLGLSGLQWDRAQVSVVYSGYPQQMSDESDAAFRYRIDHDAAHVDGLIREGPRRRRYLRHFHQFILGVPTCKVTAQTSPFVVWERSHERVREAFARYFGDLPASRWPQRDVTDFYRELRREIFATCRRVELTACGPGEAYLVHRLALHGIAPWQAQRSTRPNEARRQPAERMIIYFRPESESGSPSQWLHAP